MCRGVLLDCHSTLAGCAIMSEKYLPYFWFQEKICPEFGHEKLGNLYATGSTGTGRRDV
jgi:hypothetical protein